MLFQSSNARLIGLFAATAMLLLPVVQIQAVSVPVADTGGIYVNFTDHPSPTPGDVVVSSGAPIMFRTATILGDATDEVRIGLIEFDVAGLNPYGVFSATLGGSINDLDASDPGFHTFALSTYESDGVITANDAFGSFTFLGNINYPTTDTLVLPINRDVTNSMRAALINHAAAIGYSFNPTTRQLQSTFSDSDPIRLELEYYDDPLDALPPVTGPTGFSFRGQAGEWVTQGQTYSYTPDDTNFEIDDNFDNGISIDVGGWSIDLSMPDDEKPTIGTYEAVRWPFQDIDMAGFVISGHGRGLNTLVAEFTIHDVAYDTNDVVTLLHLTFRQTDDNGISSFGEFRYNVPEPGVVGCIAMLLPMIDRRRRKIG